MGEEDVNGKSMGTKLTELGSPPDKRSACVDVRGFEAW